MSTLNHTDFTMEFIKTIAWTVGILSFIVFVALFGRLPVFRRTPIGWIHRLLLHHIPAALIALDNYLTGKRISRSVTRLYGYLMYERHPVVMIMFVVLQAGSEILFLPPASSFLPFWHKTLLLPVLITSPYLALYLSYSTSSHHITPSTYSTALTRYPYDYTIYHPHISCRTCHWSKPARSKHCSICRTCIERQDHHCIWINNCVGLDNYSYFIALLISISALLFYGAYTGFGILEQILQEQHVPSRLTRGSLTSKRWSTALTWKQWLDAYSIVVAMNSRIGAVSLLATMTCPLALGFLVYHAYLIWAGTTTNETAKWTDLQEDISDGLVWKGRIMDVRNEYPGSLDENIVYNAEYHRGDQTSMSRGQRPNWPRREEWWLIRTRSGAQPMRSVKRGQDINANGDTTNIMNTDVSHQTTGDNNIVQVIDDRWIKVRNPTEVDNIYDIGVAGNLRDAMLRGFRD